MAKAFALIRSHFQRDPERLSDDEFAQLLNEALWLEKYRGEIMEKRLTKAVADALAMMASR